MSTADLTNAVSRVNAAATLMENANARIAAHEDAVKNAFVSNQTTMQVIVYIDAISGDDTAIGSQAAPVKTVERALALTARGGVCRAVLVSDYHLADNIQVNGKTLIFQSATTPLKKITFQPTIFVIGGTTCRAMAGFECTFNGQTYFDGIDLVFPVLAAPFDQYPTCFKNNMVRSTRNNNPHTIGSLQNCTVTLNANPQGAVFLSPGPCVTLSVVATTYVGGSMNGRWMSGSTDIAGTNPATLGWLTTNLTTV